MTLREEILKNSGLNESVYLYKSGMLFVYFWNYKFKIENDDKLLIAGTESDNKKIYDYIMSSNSALVYNPNLFKNEFGKNEVKAEVTLDYNAKKEFGTVFSGKQAENIINHVLTTAGKEYLIKWIDNTISSHKPEEKEYLEKVKKYLETT